MRKLGPMGKLKRLCKQLGTSLTKLADVAEVPLSNLTQLWDNDPGQMRYKHADRIRKCLGMTFEEWDKFVGSDWMPTQERLKFLMTDGRSRK
jgi:transcriptional regulator with XRE-family HTH domain